MQLCLNIGGLAQGTGRMVNSLKSLCLQFTIRIVGIEWCLLLGCGIRPAWKPRPRLTLGLGWMRYQVVPWILSYLMQKSNMVWVGGWEWSIEARRRRTDRRDERLQALLVRRGAVGGALQQLGRQLTRTPPVIGRFRRAEAV